MERTKEILKNVVYSLNPLNYGKLKENNIKSAVIHFFIVLFVSVLVSGIIYIPSVISFSNSIKESLNDFDTFKLNPEIKTEDPIFIWSSDYIVFDTEGNLSANASRYYIDSDFLYYNYGSNRRELTSIGNIVENSVLLGNLVLVLAFVLLPSFLISYFVVSLLLFLVILFFASTFIWILTKIFLRKKNKPVCRDIIVSCLYSSTILAFALLLNSFLSGFGYYLVIIFLLYSYVGSVSKTKNKNHESHKSKKKKKSLGDIE